MNKHVSNIKVEAKKVAAKTQVAELGKATALTLGSGREAREGMNRHWTTNL